MLLRLAILAFLALSCRTADEGSQVEDLSGPKGWFATPVAKAGLPKTPFHSVPPKAKNDRIWSGFHWSKYKMGIANRWQHHAHKNKSFHQNAGYASYKYSVPTQEEVAQLSPSQISRLSPAEKFDLYMGRPSLPLTKHVIADALKEITPDPANSYARIIPRWYGISHGWAAAAGHVKEPRYLAIKSATSDQCIQFHAEDLKALVSQAYADSSYKTVYLGERCRRDQLGKPTSECAPINPAVFHLSLSALMENGLPVITDISHDGSRWNQPVKSYRFQYGEERSFDDDPCYQKLASTPGAPKSLVDVDMTMHTVISAPPRLADNQQRFFKTTFKYTLGLDENKNVIDGYWQRACKTPDHLDLARIPRFLWSIGSQPALKGHLDYAEVIKLISLSQRGKNLCRFKNQVTTNPLEVLHRFSVKNRLNGLPTGLNRPQVDLPLAKNTWTYATPPQSPAWRPGPDSREIKCGKNLVAQDCNRNANCGWSKQQNRCIHTQHGICADYSDRSWCLATEGCAWLNRQSKPTLTSGACRFKDLSH